MHFEQSFCLQNFSVLVTGGTSGIGKAVAKLFIQHGASVVIVGTNQKNAESTCTLLQEFVHLPSQTCRYHLADVGSLHSVASLQKDLLDTFPHFDVLVLSAGITRDQLLLRMSEREFDAVLQTNLKGAFTICKTFLPPMLKRRQGNIIAISSVIGVMGNPGQANYAASKGGLISFAKSLAKEVGKRNIRVNTIAPGFIKTRMTEALPQTQIENMVRALPIQRLGTPEDVAKLALFLASDSSSYITGQTIHVDGGMVM